MKKGIIITVRLKSTRLKEKVLRKVNGKVVLKYLTDRLKKNFNGDIIICTSTNFHDTPLVTFAKEEGLSCFRGSEDDVLERYYQTCKEYKLDKFYIIYGDEPFTDLETVKENFELLKEETPMWIKNDSLPEGTYGYGMNFKGIEYLNKNKIAENMEVWQIMASNLPIHKIEHKTEVKERADNIRLTIDYEDDLQVFQEIINKIGDRYLDITLTELMDLYETENYFSINGFRINEYKARILQQGTI
tara:strand:- start:53 stop:787 length:735 start_codon:yes stop_codon:yes gene_type:complete